MSRRSDPLVAARGRTVRLSVAATAGWVTAEELDALAAPTELERWRAEGPQRERDLEVMIAKVRRRRRPARAAGDDGGQHLAG